MKINAINSINIQNKNYKDNTTFSGLFSKKYSYDYDVFMPEKQPKVKNKVLEKISDLITKEQSNDPIEQSKYFKNHGIINYKTKLADRFIYVPSNGKLYNNGICESSRGAIIVDRKNDIELQRLVKNAKVETANMDEQEKARYITEVLTHSEAKNVKKIVYPNEKVLVGNLLGSLSLGGRQNSLLFKVLSDEIGLKTDLVKGTAAGAKSIWNVVHFNNGVNKIYDLNKGIVEDSRKTKIYKPMYKK